jgi:hypothetical protein
MTVMPEDRGMPYIPLKENLPGITGLLDYRKSRPFMTAWGIFCPIKELGSGMSFESYLYRTKMV